ncbi:hypothetical protein [Chitinophaga sp. RAB17]|uniref:hypothetical protein n=1 Tax=Chitinophaga sp. RAB17 TaxID=3233049 RepID=UPI003F93D949
MHLNGKISSITSIKFGADTTAEGIVKGEPVYRDENTFAVIFNDKGDLSEKGRWNDNGKSDTKRIFKYDTIKNLKEEKEVAADGTVYRKFVSLFNTLGQEIEWQMSEKGKGITAKVLSTYDAAGNKITDQSFYKKDRPGGKTTYQYNEKGQMIERIDRKADDTIDLIHHYTHDDTGNEIVYKNFKETDVLNRMSHYKYDQHNNMIEEQAFNSDGSADATYTYTYEYDGQNNWVKKVQFVNNKARYIIEREIQYQSM